MAKKTQIKINPAALRKLERDVAAKLQPQADAPCGTRSELFLTAWQVNPLTTSMPRCSRHWPRPFPPVSSRTTKHFGMSPQRSRPARHSEKGRGCRHTYIWTSLSCRGIAGKLLSRPFTLDQVARTEHHGEAALGELTTDLDPDAPIRACHDSNRLGDGHGSRYSHPPAKRWTFMRD